MPRKPHDPDRWWNAIIEVTIPFDTEAEARAAYVDDELIDGIVEMLGGNATVSGRVEEAVVGVWPY